MNNIKSVLFYIALISAFLAVSVVSVFNWFSNGTILYYWDTLLPMSSSYALAFLYSFYPGIFPGVSGSGLSWILYVFPLSLIQSTFNNLSLAQAFIYVVLIFFSVLNFYFLLNYISKLVFDKENKFLRLFSLLFSVMYALNLYTFYYAYYLFNPDAYIIAFLPLNILALLRLFPLNQNEKIVHFKKWLLIFFVSLFLMSPGFTTYIFFIQYLGWNFIYLLFYFLISKEKRKPKLLKSFIFFVLVILANLWWFLPAVLGLHSLYSSQRFTADTTFYIDPGSKNSNLLNSLRLIGSAMMNNNPFSWFSFYIDKNPFNFILFFFPFLILFLAYKIKSIINKNFLLFLLLMFLVSLFIVKLGNPPRADITIWLFKHIPFFDAFRDAQHKAGLYYIFSYFILSFVGFHVLINYLSEKKKKILIQLSFIFLIIGFVIVTGPFFLFRNDNIKKIDYELNGKKYLFYAKTQIPKEYYGLKNVLEKECIGETTIVIPRASAITNAVWEKYHTSYIGQDILPHLINCNLISQKVGENNPDAFTNAPYILLRNKDFSSFKNFLLQNNISLVLVRKDNIPYYYSSWFYSDPEETVAEIENDQDFQKLYENDFFNLYKLKISTTKNFGFSLAKNMIYTNSSLDTAVNYAVFSKTIGSQGGGVIINTNDNLKKYSGFINQYVSVGNCVGCVQISGKNLIEENYQPSTLRMIKDFLKKYFKFLNKKETTDTKISKNLINANYEFSGLIRSIRDKKTDQSKKYINSYTGSMNEILGLLRSHNGSLFDRNQKFLETKNFLVAQNNIIVSYLPGIKDNDTRTLLNFLVIFQNKSLDFINKNIWETDSEKKLYKIRLDIAKEGTYKCDINTFTKGAFPINAYIDEESLAPLMNGNHFFKKGSYPISIRYNIVENLNVSSVKVDYIKEIDLGSITRGSYTLSFDTKGIKNPLFIVLTNGKIDLNNFNNALQNSGQNISYGYFIPDSTSETLYKKEFHIDPVANEKYYLYFVVPVFYNSSQLPQEINNVRMDKNVEENDIVFSCATPTADASKEKPPQVKKINNTKYEVTLPENFSSKFLLFNQSFNNDWKAYPENNKEPLPHFLSGYSNAWDISNISERQITVIFSRQDLIIKNIFISAFIFLIVLAVFLKIKK